MSEFYIIEFGEPNSYVSSFKPNSLMAQVDTTVGVPDKAYRFKDYESAWQVVEYLDVLCGCYAKVKKIKVTYEVVINA